MTTINRLSFLAELKDGDQVAVYSQNSGDARRASLSTLKAFVFEGATGEFQPLDETLTAISALVFAPGDFLKATGVDTFVADPLAVGDIPALPISKTTGLQAALDAKQDVSVPTYAALTAISAADRQNGDVIYVAACSVPGDGGEGEWRFDAASSATANGGTILAPDAGTGRWLRQYSGLVNVRWFGAKGDNATDDQAAFNAAGLLNYVYVPAGTYVLSASWTFTNKQVFVCGDGRANSVLKFSGTSRGIYVNNSGVFSAVDIYDIGIKTTATTPTGTAIEIVWPDTFDGRQIHKGVIANCQIEGFVNTTMGWAKGISYTRGQTVTVRDCGILGKDTNGTSSVNIQTDKTVSSIAIEYLGAGGAYPTEVRVVGCYISCWNTGFDAPGSPEGVYINNSVMINVRIGVDCEPTLATRYRPLLSISDSHIAAFEYAVYSLGMIQSYIHDNLFYFSNGGNQNGELLHLEQGSGVHVHHNGFYYYGSTYTCTGIVVQNTDTANENLLESNQFGTMNKGIWLKSTAGRTVLRGNIAEGTFAGGFIDDDSTSTVYGMGGVLVNRSSAISISNRTGTALPFNAEIYDPLGFWSTGANVVVPAGVSRIRITANVTWATNGTGFRWVRIYKAGAFTYDGRAGSITPAAPPGVDSIQTEHSITTAELTVTTGDIFTLVVFQDSGGALNVEAGASMCIEVLA
jgi:hypothetical protein